jgi:hypothetical protein
VAGVAADLLLLAAFAGLDNSHEVCMVSLLLCLGSSGGRVGHIATILGHNLHSRQVREISGLLAGGGLGRRAARGSSVHVAPIPVGCDRARVERSITRVLERASTSRRFDRSGKCVNGIELEGLSSQVRIFKIVERDGGTLLLGRSRARDVSVHQLVELPGSNGREELELGAKSGLEDREPLRKSVRISRHCKL